MKSAVVQLPGLNRDRDMIAARLGGRLPRLATWLRSF